jgi:1,4-dihydroxy-6-naphthoate synthase
MAKRISIGISPCPNDTYIFYALLTGKVIVPGLEFEVFMEDVEQLNRWALDGKLDVTKLSFNAYAHVLHNYILLNTGAALGNGCGPLLISRPGFTLSSIMDARVAIPGFYTTAYFLLRLLYPELKHVEVCLFSEIEDKICSGEVDAGLVIHENRFTYQQKGLVSLIDLGEYWENLTWLPIPLGGIIAKRNISVEILKNIEVGIKKSLEYAYAHEDEVLNYCAQYAQTMTRDVMLQHIRLYVNEYSHSLGDVGITAVKRLLEMAVERNMIPDYNKTDLVLQ